jgi:voltage-gated potassium channel
MSWKEQVRAALDGDHPVLGHSITLVLYALIAFSTLSIGIETIPDLPADIRIFLVVMEWITVALFSIEYALRIWIAPDKLAYIRSFYGIIDLLAVLPFYLSLGVDLRALRAFRLFRLLRLFKVARYNRATRRIATALKLVREELIVFAAFAIFTLYLCGIGIYYCEHDAQPKVFASVFDGIWWAAVTLTTVGYGDVYPVTLGGRLLTMAIMFVALGAIAVPTGLISSAMTRLRHAEEEEEDDRT